MLNPEVAIPLVVGIATPVALVYRWLQHRERMARIAADARRPAAVADGERLARMERLERAVESIALEVERVGEGQRYLTRVLADRPPQGAAPMPRAQTNTPH